MTVIRYKGSKNIKEMVENEQYIDAFVHAQLGIEKILWDKIVGIFETEKAREVRRRIDELKDMITKTRELIKWGYFLGAINYEEFKVLMEFNKARNKIIHGHGKWWVLEDNRKQYYEAKLKSAIQFLENNGL